MIAARPSRVVSLRFAWALLLGGSSACAFEAENLETVRAPAAVLDKELDPHPELRDFVQAQMDGSNVPASRWPWR